MKKLERKPRDEKRRLQLNKANPQAAAAALEKVQGLNRRVLAVVLAIAMVVGLIPIAINLIVKGATKDAAHTLTALPYTVTGADDAAHRFKSGDTYFYEYEGRTYTYEFDENLIEGDVLSFNTDSKSIEWARSGVYGITNIEDVVNKAADSSDPTPTFEYAQDKNGGGPEVVAGQDYYYHAEDGTNYVFSFAEDVALVNRARVRTTDGVVTDYHVGSFMLDFDENDPIATVNENLYQLHSFYVEENALTNGEVYLIEGENEGIMIGYTGATDGTITENYGTFSGSSGTLTNYELDLSKGGNYQIWEGANPVLMQNDNVTFSGKKYYDGGYVLAGSNTGTYSAYLLNEFQPAARGNNKILKAIVPDNFSYSTDRILGHYYNTSNNRGVYIHAASTRSHGLGTDNNDWSVWTYSTSDRKLTSRETSGSSGNNVLKIDVSSMRVGLTNNASTLLNFRKIDAYYPEEITDKPVAITFSTPSDESGEFPVKSVSYTDNATIAGNDLEIDKTVTEVDKDEGIFDIKLEAYTTAPTLNQPATDIELVLDTSRNMNNVLYSRQYKNLNTYEGFTVIDLKTGNVTHDSLFDRDWDSLWGSITGAFGNLFTGDRNFIHNKYVEDPASPGTYVYLHQSYEPITIAGIPAYNRYRYYFTSSDGATYETILFSQNLLETVFNTLKIPATGLEFTAPGKDPVVRKEIYTLSNYSGRNTDNGSAATNNELYSISRTTGLYIKDKEGNFRRVYLYKDYRGDGTPHGVAQTGMYRYVIFENDVEYGTVEYEFSTGNTQTLNDPSKGLAGGYGVFQGFRNYNEDHELEGDYILSKTLYTLEDEDVTALQAMKEALESFLLNAHEQVANKGAEAYVGLVAYDRDAQVKYKLNSNSPSGNYTDLSIAVGDHSVDEMISDIYNYRVTQQYDRVSRQLAYYNVINDSNHNGRRYNGTYASEVDDGLALARDELANHNHDKTNSVTGENIKSRRYAILFTAGVPAAYTSFLGFDTSGTFTTSTASNAINTANDIKNNLDTTVYSVGLFDNADEEKINGDYWYYATFGQKVPCNGRVGSYWGGSWVANGFNIDPKDAYATNRMLAYISSDYSTPRTLGLTRDSYHPGRSGIWGWLSSGTGYRIDQNFSRDDTGYYLAVSPNTLIETDSTDDGDEYAHATEDVAAILADVFQKLNIATAAPNNTLTADSFLVDGITNYFDLVTNDPDHMPTAEVRDMSDHVDAAKTADLNVIYDDNDSSPTGTTKNIAVNGFPYSTYWVGDGNQNDQRKVVLTFRVKRTDGLIGGNDIPTNLSRTAIYDGDPESITDSTPWGIMEERYEIPKVDLPIEMSNFSKDASIYYGGTQDLKGVLDLSDLAEIELAGNNGTLIPNEFVTVAYEIKDGNRTINTYRVPVGSTIGVWDHPIQEDAQNDGTPGAVHEENLEKIYVQPEESTQYTVNVVVTPVYNGTVRTTSFNDNDANVYVFLPHYEVYNGMVENAGDEYDLTASGKTPLLTEWNYDEELELEEGFDPATLLNPADMPTVVFELAKYDDEIKTIPPEGKIQDTFETTGSTTTQTAESVLGDLDEYVVNQKTDLLMDNILITAKPHEYTIEQKVAENYYDSIGVIYKTVYFDADLHETETVYYDSDGNVMPDATGPREPGDYVDENNQTVPITFDPTPEPEYGSVTKEYTPTALNVTTNDKVTFLNDDDGRTNGAFTINLNSHDVKIINHTVDTANGDSDFADTTKAFPLTLTLKDGNTLVNGSFDYAFTNQAGQTTQNTLTFTNGVATINLKDAEFIVLKDVRDGYKLSVTSNPSDNYYFYYKTGTEETDFDEEELIDTDANEKTADITISDDAIIDLTHSIQEIVITGRHGIDSKLNPFLIAAGVVTVLGGAWLAYMMKRRRDSLEQNN